MKIENTVDESKVLKNIIIDLENKYYKAYELKLKYEEIFENKNKKLDRRIKSLREQIKLLENIYFKQINSNMPLSRNQIISFDYKYKTNTYELFTLLRLEENQQKKIGIINKLKSTYINLSRSILEDDYDSKIEINNVISEINKSFPFCEIMLFNVEKDAITNNPIYIDIVEGNSLEKYDTNDLITVLRKILKTKKISQNILNSTLIIINRLDKEIDNEKTILDLKDTYEKLLLTIDKKERKKYVKNLCSLLKNSTEKGYSISVNKEKEEEKEILCFNTKLHDAIINGEDISNYLLMEIMHAYIDVINKSKINDNILKTSNEILNRINNNEEYNIEILYGIIDAIKWKKKKYDKSSKERNMLRKISKDFEKIIEFTELKLSDELVEDKYLFDIIKTLLYDETGYLVIKKILEEYPKTVNVIVDSKHIVEYIFEFFLKNYEKAITSNMAEYINIDYIKEVYYLFLNNENIELSLELQDKINNQIKLFLDRVTSNHNLKEIEIEGKKYKTIIVRNDKRKTYIETELINLRDNYKKEKPSFELRKIDEEIVEKQMMNEVLLSAHEDIVDLMDDENIILDNEYITYNYKSDENNSILRVSVPDMTRIISDSTQINDYIYNQMLKGEKIDNRLLDRLKFKDGKKMYSITFKIVFNKSNKPVSIFMYKSKLIPKKVSKDNTMNKELKKMLSKVVYKKGYERINISNSEVEETVRKIVNELYLKEAKDKNIPYIYSGVEKVKPIKVSMYSNLMPILNKLSKEDVKKIHKIMNSNLGEFHYSQKPFKVEDEFDLNLIGEPNYIFLQNQRMIKSLFINRFGNANVDALDIEQKNIVDDLNASVNYKKVYDPNLIIKKKTLLV